MKNLKLPYKVFLFCTLILALGACKSKKQIVSSDGSVIQKSQQQLLDDVLNSQLNYITINGKISLEIIAGDKTSGMKANARLKIVKNDIIQLSILAPFINSELFRMNITPDSVYIIDRMAKKYAVADIKNLDKRTMIQLNYYNLQSMFTNGLFMPGKKEVSRSDYDAYSITQNSDKYLIQTKDKAEVDYNFVVNSNDRIESTNLSVDDMEDKYSMSWTYEDFVKDNSYIYPTRITAKVSMMMVTYKDLIENSNEIFPDFIPVKKEIKNRQVSLVMNYSGLDIDKELNVDKSLPSRYEKVTVMDILKNYIK